MKAEINNENKAKFIALYTPYGKLFYRFGVEQMKLENIILNLKTLSKISDEDSIQVFDYIFGGKDANKNKSINEKITFGKEWASCYGKFFNYGSGHFGYETGNVIDLLRSKSYALPWMNLSVDEMIEAGWIKLIEE